VNLNNGEKYNVLHSEYAKRSDSQASRKLRGTEPLHHDLSRALKNPNSKSFSVLIL
jgi:hypothetical protein